VIDHAVERSIARRVVAQRFEDFQVPQGCIIEGEIIVAAIKRQPREIRDIAPQVLCEIMQRRARRADGRRAVL